MQFGSYCFFLCRESLVVPMVSRKMVTGKELTQTTQNGFPLKGLKGLYGLELP